MATILSIFLIQSQCRHKRLEPHVLDAGDELRRLEILVRRVATALAQVVHEVLGDLAERAALLAEVDDDADAAALRGADALLDGENKVRFARADVRAEYVRAVAFVVDTQGELLGFVVHERGITD